MSPDQKAAAIKDLTELHSQVLHTAKHLHKRSGEISLEDFQYEMEHVLLSHIANDVQMILLCSFDVDIDEGKP